MNANNQKNYMLKATLKTILIPVVVFVVLNIVDLLGPTHNALIANVVDLTNFARNLIIYFAFALGLHVNMTMGRMDLSLGAQMYLGVIFGGNIALSLNLGGIGVIVLSMLIGALAGVVSGVLFVKMRILPMVLGLGMTLVYECISYLAYNAAGITLFGKPGTSILSEVWFIILVVVALVLVSTYVLQMSMFGYKRRAIQGSQRLAHDAGINIYSNCVVCYALCGALVALAGVFTTSYNGSLIPSIGMASNGRVFSNMFPMILGTWIGSFSGNATIGTLSASISVYFLKAGLSKLGLDDLTSTIIIYGAWLLFMIIQAAAPRYAHKKAYKARKELAQKTRRELAASV